ncbi:MAG TPA: hypothetical protein VNM90_25215, partial [Haliangium sp.]|nr:hypothetical protein [Haliangium sp.]
LGAILVAGAAILMSRADVLGVLVGVALSCANFTLMRRMVQWWIQTPPERRGARTFVLLPKMTGMMLAVALAIFFLPVSAIGVLVGFSVFLGSIAIETARYTLAGPARRPADSAGSADSAERGANPGSPPGAGPDGDRPE